MLATRNWVDYAFLPDATEILDTDGGGVYDNADISIYPGADQVIELPMVSNTLTIMKNQKCR